MKRSFFIIFLIVGCCFSIFAQSKITKDEYAVYAAVMKDIYTERLRESKEQTSFVFLDETRVTDDSDNSEASETENVEIDLGEDAEYLKEFTDILRNTKGLNEDFERKNKASVKLQRLFPTKLKYTLTSKSEIEKLLEIGRKEYEKFQEKLKHENKLVIPSYGSDIIWKDFYKKFPDAHGYYQFSRIGFSFNKNYAVVDVEGKGNYWSFSSTYILKKNKKGWRIFKEFGLHTIA